MFKDYKYTTLLLFAFIGILTITSCGDDDPEPPEEEELITTLNLTLTSASGDVSTFTWQDLDGDGGGIDPIVDIITLEANQTYTGSIELLNESESPAEDITAEVRDEDDEHQFFFQSTTAGLSVAYGDEDDNGNPLGLINTITTGDANSGDLLITLIHRPEKEAEGVMDGDITNAGGTTDVAATFPVNVQ